MRKFKYGGAVVRLAAALLFVELFGGCSWGTLSVYAMGTVPETAAEAAPEDWSDDSEEISDDEIDQMVEEYFQKLESGQVTIEDISTERIVDPQLSMEQTRNGSIRYVLPDGSYYESTVPNGMITGYSVDFFLPQGVMGLVTKDDKGAGVSDSWHFTEPGSYHVILLFYESMSQDAEKYSIYEVNHHFTIVDRTTGKLGAVTAPKDFQITSVKKDGISQEISNPECVFLRGEGRFEVRYQDTKTGTVHISTSFNRDTTAPFLTFSQDISRGTVTGPVEFTPSEVGCRVTIAYNGSRSEAVSNTLTTAGNYELEVLDDAGNSRSYYIRIRQTYELLDTRLIILALIILVGTGGRLLFLRRNMKVI